MFFPRPTLGDVALAAGYFVAAALAILLTRFDGGVACLWMATALLIPALARRSRRKWATPLLLCGVASVIATGTLGLGWRLSVPFAMINLTEAVVGATMLAQSRSVKATFHSLGWLGNFIIAVGLVAPAVVGVLAATVLMEAGRPFGGTFIRFFAGHALGNITFIPMVALIFGGQVRTRLRQFTQRRAMEVTALLLLVAIVTALTFMVDSLPLLFLPLLPIVLATFRGREIGAAMSIVLLALIGGGLTTAGHGPIQLIDAPFGVKIQFFQFYLAAVVLTVLPVAADLRNRARLHRELRHSEARYRLLADHASDIMMHVDLDGTIRFVSPSIRQLGDYEPDEMIGRLATDFIAERDVDAVRAAHAATVAAKGATHCFEYRAIMHDGCERWFETHGRAIVDGEGKVESVLSVLRDVTERRSAQARLTEAALTDVLTGLPNRRAFWAIAGTEMAASTDRCGASIAVLDLDHFKRINDVHGHDGGDAVLRQFALLAREVLRDGDTVARLGGEEFALLLPATSVVDAIVICDRLRREVSEMGVPTRTGMIRVTLSGGVAKLGEDGLEAALKRADLALYEAKAGGRDQLQLAA